MSDNNETTFYIVRHGETEWNVQKRIQGQKDIQLNTNGEQQARELAEAFKNTHFDSVFSSDLSRAKRTAEIIVLERKIAVETTKLLRERQLGKFVGQPSELLKTLDSEYKKLDENGKKNYKAANEIEDTDEMVSRFITFLRETAVAYPGKTILVATHGGMIRVLLTHLGFYEGDKNHVGSVSNGGYVKLLSDGVNFFINETKGIHKTGELKLV